MGRKKKNKSSLEGAADRSPSFGPSSTVVAAGAPPTNSYGADHGNAVQVLTVRLLSSAGGRNGSSSSNNEPPRVLLAEEDADALGVRPGDAVILLSHRRAPVNDDMEEEEEEEEETKSSTGIIGAAVYRAAPFSPSASPAGRTSTPTASGSPRKRKPLSAGNVQLTSQSAVDLLLPRQSAAPLSQAAGEGKATTQPVVHSPPAEAFSFKADVNRQRNTPLKSPRTTPSSARRTPTSRDTPSSQQQHRVWILAANSPLGRSIGKTLFPHEAGKVILQVVDEEDGGDDGDEQQRKHPSVLVELKRAEQILKRIVLAHSAGRYVQSDERIRCSFRGKPLELKVVRVEGVKATANEETTATPTPNPTTVEGAFANLTINDDESNDDSADAKLVKESIATFPIRLFFVTYSTVIEFSRTPSCDHNKQQQEEEASIDDGDEASIKEQQYVAGLTSTLEQVRSLLVTPLSHPDVFSRGSMKAPKGLLLHGPSGVGKSSLAKQLVHELDDSTCEVVYVNCTSIQSKTAIVGEAERHLSRLFRVPTDSSHRTRLLIFDDVHLICPKRGGYNPGTDRMAATLLSLIDGVDSSSKHASRIMILAITNNPSLLDPALRRPGRLDAEVEVPIPDEASTRGEILQFQVASLGAQLADSNSTEEGTWLELGKLAKGFNGADCTLAVKEALRKSILKGYPTQPKTATGNESKQVVIDLAVDDLKAAIRETKPSAIKSVTVEIPQVHWSSIGGMESVKRELRDAVELPLTHGELFEQLRVPPPRGILLYGPPGCSKTLMARALATEGQMNFLAVKGPELLSKWLGESERALAALFRRARMASPCIIFFDEIDAIAMKRGSGDSASSSRLLSQLLTELDGVNNTGAAAAVGNKRQKFVVIGATNRPDLLDAALTRPGRIDKMIFVGVPDAASRAQIFRISLQDRACGTDIDIPYLARDEISEGFSGAEIVALCRDAALLALEEADDFQSEATVVEMRHLIAATKGMKRQITPSMLAFYESFRGSSNTV